MLFSKIVPAPKNSLATARRIQKPQAMAVSQKSSPYSPSIAPVSTCFTMKSPKIQVIIHIPVLSTGIPRAVNPRRNTEAHTATVPMHTHKYRLHSGTQSFNRFLRASAKTVARITRIPAAKASFIPAENNTIPKANASAGYFNFILYPPLFLFHCL